MKIFKYPLTVTSLHGFQLPEGAHILSVGVDASGGPVLWAVVDPTAELTPRRIHIIPTGRELPSDMGRYLGTIALVHASVILHIYDEVGY